MLTANAQLQALQSLTDVALSDLPTDLLMERLLERVIAGVDGGAGAVFLIDPTTGRLGPRTTIRHEPAAGEPEVSEWAAELAAHVVAPESGDWLFEQAVAQ